MDLAYVAHSEQCALLLDADRVCRWIVPKVGANDNAVAEAKRCLGGQYVASLDPNAHGLMGREPRVGTNLLFALLTSKGRVAVARFGPIQSFEELDAPNVASVSDTESSATTSTPLAADADDLEAIDDLDDIIASFARDDADSSGIPGTDDGLPLGLDDEIAPPPSSAVLIREAALPRDDLERRAFFDLALDDSPEEDEDVVTRPFSRDGDLPRIAPDFLDWLHQNAGE